MAYLDEVYSKDNLDEALNKIKSFSRKEAEFEQEQANALLKLKIDNAKQLYEAQKQFALNEASWRIKQESEIQKKLVQMGFDAKAAQEAQERKNSLKAAQAALKEAKKSGDALKVWAAKASIADIKKEYKQRSAEQKKLDKQINDAEKARQKEAIDAAKSIQSSSGVGAFGSGAEYIYRELRAKGYSEEEARAAVKSNQRNQLKNIALNFAKQLESTVNEIAHAQSEIDTRMQGSSQSRRYGSYWKAMNNDITKNVGMSAVVKQADIVNSLKTLVGKGIAFNVEQRAFLDTVSDKIATTFEATDSTLVKLVRIQQADTTAARLGMESALTAFLNNMYETTEYMTDAAASIRQSLYEASSLMGAAEATAFEYQVQKWMGSLYSVGFSNTHGLADALGKLAAGDISSINNGGYGNLLIMAANRAGLSIADMLANGLSDSETNQLMQSMVEYLGGIYAETKNSKVVAQQFANVYGLTASDLKAAANLYGSTDTIAKNRLNYSGMLNQLNMMASSMWQRTSTGELMDNLFSNFNYAIAGSMANNPVLYSLYHIASMLEDTTGGSPLPAIMTMGTGVNMMTKISELMRLGALGGGILEGIGTMLGGLSNGIGAAAMLKNFGIDNNLTTLTRGTGTGISAINYTSITESGYIGNANGSDVQNATMSSANEQAESQLSNVEDSRNETKLSTVDDHIMLIHDLLQSVIDSGSVNVKFGNVSGFADLMNGGI